MKLLKYISVIAAMLVITYGCEFNDKGNMPEDMKEGCFAYFAYDATVSTNVISFLDPESFTFSGSVDVLFDSPYDKLQLVVVYNDAYEKPHILKDDITDVPLKVTYKVSDLVNAISDLSTIEDIKIEDKFHVFVIPFVDDVAFPPFQKLDGKVYRTYSSSIDQNLLALKSIGSVDVRISVPNPFHPLTDWIGTFSAKAVSYGSPGEWDENWKLTATKDPDDETNLIIFGIGSDTGVGVVAKVDKENGTITIAAGSPVGDAYGYGNMVIYKGTPAGDDVDKKAPIVGTISADGSIAIDNVGLMIIDGDYAGYLWDVFNSTWTKDKSAFISTSKISDSKTKRFK
jgi:hypothetical protein